MLSLDTSDAGGRAMKPHFLVNGFKSERAAFMVC